MNIRKFMMPFFNRFIFCCITLGGYCQLSTGQIVELSNNIWSININTDTLEMSAQPKKSSRTILNYPTIKDLSTHVKANKNKVSWQLSKYKLALSLELKKEDLFLKIISNKNQPLTIFKYSPDTNHIGYILPISEGLYFPDDDQTWQEIILSNHQKGDTTSSLSMPLISIVKKDYLLNYIFINPYNNEYSWSKSNNHLELLFIHNFNSLEPYLPFELLINLSENNDLLSGAKRYKKILKKTNNFQSLKEKIRKNPDTKKIIGASHIYLVGESLLSAHNVTNWNNFISILNLDTSVPSKLRSSFSQESIEILQNGTDINDEQKYILISDLNESIKQFNYKTTDSINMLTDLFSNNITAPKTWGDGLSKIMIDMLKNAKINKSWLGFHNISHGINQFDTIRFAKNNGFLVSPNYMPYNIYIQQKNKSNRSKLENNIYKTCRILKSLNQEDSNNQQYLNPNCIESYERNKILQIQKEIQTNSWYIVKDGKGQLHNDYNRKHPLSQKQYAKTISKKFNWLVKNFQIVVGSSSGNAIVAKNLSFAHVDLFPDSTIKDNDLVQESSKFFLGNLSPKYMPSIFFRQSILKEKYKDTYLNPIYRLPLYQALLHDSVVLAHHDKFDIFKFSNVKNIYILLDLLYNTPPLYYLNLSNIKDRLPKIKEIHNFFYTTHNHLATLSLVKFDYLSSDRFLQKTTFSDQSIIIANFSDNKRKYKKLNLPPYSVTAILKGKKTLQFQTKDIS